MMSLHNHSCELPLPTSVIPLSPHILHLHFESIFSPIFPGRSLTSNFLYREILAPGCRICGFGACFREWRSQGQQRDSRDNGYHWQHAEKGREFSHLAASGLSSGLHWGSWRKLTQSCHQVQRSGSTAKGAAVDGTSGGSQQENKFTCSAIDDLPLDMPLDINFDLSQSLSFPQSGPQSSQHSNAESTFMLKEEVSRSSIVGSQAVHTWASPTTSSQRTYTFPLFGTKKEMPRAKANSIWVSCVSLMHQQPFWML